MQFRSHERFWLETGVGIGVPFDSKVDDWDDGAFWDRYDRSWAGLVGAGCELTRKGWFVLDI